MFGSLGGTEILLILVLALLLFGPRSLPQIGRTIGRALSEFRKATHDLRTGLEREVELEQLRDTRNGLRSASREIHGAVDDLREAALRSTPSVAAPGSSDQPPDEGGSVTESAAAEDSPGDAEKPDQP